MLPKSPPPPDCPGVAVVLPNRPPAGLEAFPKSPPPVLCPEVALSFCLGVCDALPKRDDVWPVDEDWF